MVVVMFVIVTTMMVIEVKAIIMVITMAYKCVFVVFPGHRDERHMCFIPTEKEILLQK